MTAPYSLQTKIDALDLLIQHENVDAVSAQTGIATRTLRLWRQRRKEIVAAYRQQQAERHEIRAAQIQTKVERLHTQLADNALRLSTALTDTIEDAPLNQVASALGTVVDRFLMVDEHLKPPDDEIEDVFSHPTLSPPPKTPASGSSPLPAQRSGEGPGVRAAPHPDQQSIIEDTTRFKVVACGRRFGKTETGKRVILDHAKAGDTTWWLAPTYAMARAVWRDLKTALRREKKLRISETEQRIDFPNGGSIEIHSTFTADHLRGAGLDLVVLDEAAYMQPDVWQEVVRPMLLESQGRALFLSTPRGHNHFYRLYQLGLDPLEKDWASFQHPSADNPLIAPSELADIKRITPERVYREEYLAEFVADIGQVFRGIYEAASVPLGGLPQPGHTYVMGVDWGRDQDYTCAVVIDSTTQQMVALERFTGISWAMQQQRIRRIAQHWDVSMIWAETNSAGSVNIERLREMDLPVRPFQTTATSKPPLIDALALAIELRELALLNDPVLLHEMAMFGMERTASGGYRYGAPSGEHDDTVIATALAWHGVISGSIRFDFV